MKNRKRKTGGRLGRTLSIAAGAAVLFAGFAPAGVPLNNLQGAGGTAFNPLAYTAGQNPDEDQGFVSKPQFGVWYVNLGDVKVDWTAIGTAITLGQRLELSYGQELIAQRGGDNIRKNNLGAKLLLINENAGDHAWVPAVSVGGIWKNTSAVLPAGTDRSGVDGYLAATKFITQTPRPVLLSGGLLYTKERVTGVFGHDPDRDLTWFGNVNVLPLPNLSVGLEYKQGASYGTFKNANYWNAHVAWFANEHLTLVAAYVNAGNENSASKVGLGDGVALSVQYAF